MKFGESLNEGLVPEWKDQYVDYKRGKKLIKSVAELWNQYNEQKASDTTPLLDPIEEGAGYFPDIGLDPPHERSEAPQDEASSKRRPSIFNFSVKSPKQRKEDYIAERSNFLNWLNDELHMVDEFYKEKEKDVYTRFLVLEDQFFQLKEQRTQVVRRAQAQASALEDINAKVAEFAGPFKFIVQFFSRLDTPSLPTLIFLEQWRSKPLKQLFSMKRTRSEDLRFDPNYRENQIRNGKVSDESDFDDDLLFMLELEEAVTQADTRQRARQSRHRDYTKKHFGVPYYYARRQLKNALIEHYRLILLIRSYKTMNRTAFRKITKKFDKAMGSKISEDFMKRVDTDSYFQTSTVLEKILSRVEDLFLTFFDSENEDRKHGLEKLRSATYAYNNADTRSPQFYPSVFITGLSLGVGLPFLGIALYTVFHKEASGLYPEGKYLLQIWAGFYLLLLAMLLIGVNFAVYTEFKINYKFIFEFNLATALNYRQFVLLPAMGFGFWATCFWLSFADFWPNTFPGRDFPLLFLAVCLIVFLWPGAQFFASGRRWLQVALWRILCSGFYPVEFRDFYIGDILCSLTFTLSNLSYFICLYADKWRHILGGGEFPHSSSRCGSKHSRTMGFLAALPSIWRFLQCARRYTDSGDAFPHLANMLKYLVGALYYCLLSVWRIDRTNSARAMFIFFATLNSVYCSIWDIVMDWSLGQSGATYPFLRNNLFYKRPQYYYAAIVSDVILRFQWIFYAFFSTQIQQLAVTSFFIALAEILRRFLWMFLRMENEHCSNVILFRASRDSPLPYPVSTKVERAVSKLVNLRYEGRPVDDEFSIVFDNKSLSSVGHTTAISDRASRRSKDDEPSVGRRHPPPQERRKSTFVTISDALNKAHIKDFQRKKYAVPNEESDEDEEDEEVAKVSIHELVS